MSAIKPQDLISQLESIIEDIKDSGWTRPTVSDVRDSLLGMVDELYCETWCDDTEDCCYDDKICNDCEYNEDCENADVTDEDDEEEGEE